MHLVVPWILLALCLSSCGGASSAPAQSPSPKASKQPQNGSEPASPFKALEEQKLRLLSQQAPRYRGTGDKQGTFLFLNQTLKPWRSERDRATQALVAKYDALHPTTDQTVTTKAMQAKAELYVHLSREFIVSACGAIPLEFRSDPEAHLTYVQTAIHLAEPSLNNAQDAITRCLESAHPTEATPSPGCNVLQKELTRIRTATTWTTLEGAASN